MFLLFGPFLVVCLMVDLLIFMTSWLLWSKAPASLFSKDEMEVVLAQMDSFCTGNGRASQLGCHPALAAYSLCCVYHVKTCFCHRAVGHWVPKAIRFGRRNK